MSGDIFTNEDKKIVVRTYRRLLKKSKPLLNVGDMVNIKKAFHFLDKIYAEKRRKTGHPYIIHPLEIAIICVVELELDGIAILGALLHDVILHNHATKEDLEIKFGEKIATIVGDITKASAIYNQDSNVQAENFRKMLLSLATDIRVILIKLADRLHNMRTLDVMSNDTQMTLASETLYIYAPLAHRLGLYNIKSELEDLAFKYISPEKYNLINNTLDESKKSRNAFIRKFTTPIKKLLHDNGFKAEIKGRPKSIFSINKKMENQKVKIDEIYDLFAIRIILDSEFKNEKADCWKVYSLITEVYTPNTNRLRDWISVPKANGYESLHTTVMSKTGKWVEIQIRTKRMDEIAEKGYAAHWKYKEKNTSDSKKNSGIDKWLTLVRTLIKEKNVDALEFVENFRKNLFNKEIFIFTPKGELRVLPYDSSTLDFAFAIHSEVGYNCIGAKVNNKLVPINHKLQSGSQVEILTSKKQAPKRTWLEHVVTSRAIAAIKSKIKEKTKEQENEGKKIIEKIAEKLKISLSKADFVYAQTFFNVPSLSTFFIYVCNKRIAISALKNCLEKLKKNTVNNQDLVKEQISNNSINNSHHTPTLDINEIVIGEKKAQDIDVHLAKCCNPKPNNDIFGFITIGEGVKIHRTACPNAIELMSRYSYRMIKARWSLADDINYMAVHISLEGNDRNKMMQDIINAITNIEQTKLDSISGNANQDLFKCDIIMSVNGKNKIEYIINKLKNVDDVLIAKYEIQ